MTELDVATDEQLSVEIYSTDRYWLNTSHGRLLDLTLGNLAFVYGYNYSPVFDRMAETQRRIGFLNAKRSEHCRDNTELVERLCKLGGFDSIAWAVSGSDGVEAAIAINDLYWQQLGQNRPGIISFTPGYHGTTFLCKMLCGNAPAYNRVKTIMHQGWDSVEHRNAAELKTLSRLVKVLKETPDTVGAIIIESIPWLAGFKDWSPNFWAMVRRISNDFGVLFIVDDVLGCVGKLGHVFSHQRYQVQPDIVVLGKALTNGANPLSAACVTTNIANVVRDVWTHGHTWQPNMGGVGAALAVLDQFNEQVASGVARRLKTLVESLCQRGLVTDITTVGLLGLMTARKEIAPDDYVRCGLSGRYFETPKNKITICAPLIADDEYFSELQSRLNKVLAQ